MALALWTTAPRHLRAVAVQAAALRAARVSGIALLAVRGWGAPRRGARSSPSTWSSSPRSPSAPCRGDGRRRAFWTRSSPRPTWPRGRKRRRPASPLPPWSELGPLVARRAHLRRRCARPRRGVRRASAAARRGRGPRHDARHDAARDVGRRARRLGAVGGGAGGGPQAGAAPGDLLVPRGADRELRRARVVLGPPARPRRRAAQRPRLRRDLSPKRAGRSGMRPTSRARGRAAGACSW